MVLADSGRGRQQYGEERKNRSLLLNSRSRPYGVFACLCGAVCLCATLAKLTVKELRRKDRELKRQMKRDEGGGEV